MNNKHKMVFFIVKNVQRLIYLLILNVYIYFYTIVSCSVFFSEAKEVFVDTVIWSMILFSQAISTSLHLSILSALSQNSNETNNLKTYCIQT